MTCRKFGYVFFLSTIFLFIFIGTLYYSPRNAVLTVIGDLVGVLIVYLVWVTLDNIADRVHSGIYWRFGLDLVYDFLKGRRGSVRQFYSIFILISLPLFALNSHSSNEFFWRVIIPVDITTTLAIMYVITCAKRSKREGK